MDGKCYNLGEEREKCVGIGREENIVRRGLELQFAQFFMTSATIRDSKKYDRQQLIDD